MYYPLINLSSWDLFPTFQNILSCIKKKPIALELDPTKHDEIVQNIKSLIQQPLDMEAIKELSLEEQKEMCILPDKVKAQLIKENDNMD